MLVYLLMAIARAISALNLRMAELVYVGPLSSHVGPLSEWQIQSLGAASLSVATNMAEHKAKPCIAETKFSDYH